MLNRYGARSVEFNSYDPSGRFHFSGRFLSDPRSELSGLFNVYATINGCPFSINTECTFSVAQVDPDLLIVRRWNKKRGVFEEVDFYEKEYCNK